MIHCPRDGKELIKLIDRPWVVLHCDDCTGAFIKGLPIDQYKPTGNTQPREEWDCEVLCPEHGEKMDALTADGVTVDICATCGGVWLDGDEIETLLGSDCSKHLSSKRSALTLTDSANSRDDTIASLLGTALSVLERSTR